MTLAWRVGPEGRGGGLAMQHDCIAHLSATMPGPLSGSPGWEPGEPPSPRGGRRIFPSKFDDGFRRDDERWDRAKASGRRSSMLPVSKICLAQRINTFSLPLAGRVGPKDRGGGLAVHQDCIAHISAPMPDPHPASPAGSRVSHVPREGEGGYFQVNQTTAFAGMTNDGIGRKLQGTSHQCSP